MSAKALFLDRDGTINVDNAYVHKIEDFRFIDGIFELCRAAVAREYLIFVITNQSGIERGYFTDEAFQKLTQWMLEQFRKENIPIADVFYCPSLSGYDRKPSPGMFEKAAKQYKIDLSLSVSLGDKERDIEAGIRAGVGKNVLLDEEMTSVNTSADITIHRLTDLINLL